MRRRWLRFAASPLVALVLAACGGAVSDEYEREEPYTVEEVEGQDFLRVILTESAVERLDIQTEPVASSSSSLVVPAEAVYLDADGSTWVFTNPEPLVYVREVVDVIRETSELAYLSEGPAPGTEVVTVGIPELYGAETGFGT
jgi:hypothetical protein